MTDADLIEQLRAKVMSLRSPRGASRGHRDATDSSCSTASKDSSSKLNSGHGICLSRMAGHEADSAIVVNVGGVNYTTTVATLKAVESSYFSLMLNGLWEPARTRGGDIFVDRNGELFGYILEHLRGQCHREPDTFQLPDDLDTLKSLLREAEFYRLPALVSRLNKRKEELMDAKDRSDTEPDINVNNARIDTVEPVMELDIAYSAVSSPHAMFTEEAVCDLTMRVNYQILKKSNDGFRVKDVNSRVHLNPNDPMLPYSMTCTAVLVRERTAQRTPGYAVAPAVQNVKNLSQIPVVLHHQQPQLPVVHHPSTVQSPRHEIGCYSEEANTLVPPSVDRFLHRQVAVSSTPEHVPDPLQQVTEARLKLQALVAEHASKDCPPDVDRSIQSRSLAPDQSVNGILDHSANPPPGVLDVSASRHSQRLLSSEHSITQKTAISVGSALDAPSSDPLVGNYSGEVQHIVGIPQAPGCQSNPPRLMDPADLHAQAAGATALQGGYQQANNQEPTSGGSETSDKNNNLGVETAERSELEDSHEQGGLRVTDYPNQQNERQKWDQSVTSRGVELGTSSIVSGDRGDQGVALEQSVVQNETGVSTAADCFTESPCTGNPTSEAGVNEPPIASGTQSSAVDGQQENAMQVPPLMLPVTIGPPACEPAGDRRAVAPKSEANNESKEVNSEENLDGVPSATYRSGNGSSQEDGAADPCDSTGDEKPDSTAASPRSFLDAARVLQDGPPNQDNKFRNGGDILPGAEELPNSNAKLGKRDDGFDGTEGTEIQQASEPPSEHSVRQPPTPDRKAGDRQVNSNGMDATDGLLSPPDSRTATEVIGEVIERSGMPTAEEKVGCLENPADAVKPGEMCAPSGSTSQDVVPTEIGDVAKEPTSPAGTVNVSVANVPGFTRALLPPPKYSRYYSARQEEPHGPPQPGVTAKAEPLHVGAHKPEASQPLLQKSKIASKGKVRSRIPHLNLGSITSSVSREGGQVGGRRAAADYNEDRPQGSGTGCLPRFGSGQSKRAGMARPGAAASGLAKQAPSTTSHRTGGRGRRH